MKPRLGLGLVLLAGCCVSQAQAQPRLQGKIPASRPLTAREGKAIVKAALKRDEQADPQPDCSHLVHEVYLRAGYPYPYTPSDDLYIGIRSFVRIKKPRPGDLVVWRGHVGIVVDPGEHSFYSSVSTGLQTEFYDTPDWKARGPARFYRYAAAKPAHLALAANRPEKIRKNAVPAISAPVALDAQEDLPESMQSSMKNSNFPPSRVADNTPPSARATFDTRGGSSH